MKGKKIIHYRKNCIGCNACVLIAPYTWMINETDGKSSLIQGIKKGEVIIAPLLDHEIEDNQKAIEACPMKIIKIE